MSEEAAVKQGKPRFKTFILQETSVEASSSTLRSE